MPTTRGVVVQRGVDGHRAPAAADVEQARARVARAARACGRPARAWPPAPRRAWRRARRTGRTSTSSTGRARGGRSRCRRRSGARSPRHRAAASGASRASRASSGGGGSGRPSAPTRLAATTAVGSTFHARPWIGNLGLGVAKRSDDIEDVAVELDVAGDVGPAEPELVGHPQHPADRVGRVESQRRRRCRSEGRALDPSQNSKRIGILRPKLPSMTGLIAAATWPSVSIVRAAVVTSSVSEVWAGGTISSPLCSVLPSLERTRTRAGNRGSPGLGGRFPTAATCRNRGLRQHVDDRGHGFAGAGHGGQARDHPTPLPVGRPSG